MAHAETDNVNGDITDPYSDFGQLTNTTHSAVGPLDSPICWTECFVHRERLVEVPRIVCVELDASADDGVDSLISTMHGTDRRGASRRPQDRCAIPHQGWSAPLSHGSGLRLVVTVDREVDIEKPDPVGSKVVGKGILSGSTASS